MRVILTNRRGHIEGPAGSIIRMRFIRLYFILCQLKKAVYKILSCNEELKKITLTCRAIPEAVLQNFWAKFQKRLILDKRMHKISNTPKFKHPQI